LFFGHIESHEPTLRRNGRLSTTSLTQEKRLFGKSNNYGGHDVTREGGAFLKVVSRK
jgi:hypothetical protein